MKVRVGTTASIGANKTRKKPNGATNKRQKDILFIIFFFLVNLGLYYNRQSYFFIQPLFLHNTPVVAKAVVDVWVTDKVRGLVWVIIGGGQKWGGLVILVLLVRLVAGDTDPL